MSDPNTPVTEPDTAIPAFLQRDPAEATAKQAETKAKLKGAAATIAAKHNADVVKSEPVEAQAHRKGKRSGKRKVKIVATTVKAEPAPAPAAEGTPPAEQTPHKPSTIVRTEGNQAKSIVPVRFKAAYAPHNDTNGDQVGLTLKAYTTTKNADGRDALDTRLLREVAEANGVDFSKYAHLNNGQQRMNVGNKLRGLLKAGKPVVIGTDRFESTAALAKPAPVAAS